MSEERQFEDEFESEEEANRTLWLFRLTDEKKAERVLHAMCYLGHLEYDPVTDLYKRTPDEVTQKRFENRIRFGKG